METYLNEEEIKLINKQISERRKPGTYEPGKWSVSSFNRAPEAFAVAPKGFPRKITIRDITLRTLHQKPGVAIRKEDRFVLARALVEAGLKSIQAAWASFADFDGVRKEIEFMRSLSSGLEITMTGGGTTKEHLQKARDAGIDLVALTVVSVPTWNYIHGPMAREIRRAYLEGENWREKIKVPTTVAEQIERMSRFVHDITDMGMRASVGMNMLAYANQEYLEAFIPAVVKAGATDLALADGSSGMGPEAWRYVVSQARRLGPSLRISVHTHNSFGLACASALASVQGGCDVVEASVNGMCSASGQADIAEVAAALEVLYGVDTGIHLEKLTWLRKLAEDITGFRVANNKAVTGDLVWYYTEEGIVEEVTVEPLLHRCCHGEVFGNQDGYALGQYSGNGTMMHKLTELGIPVSRQQVPAILAQVKEKMADHRRALTDTEIRSVAEEVLKRGAA